LAQSQTSGVRFNKVKPNLKAKEIKQHTKARTPSSTAKREQKKR